MNKTALNFVHGWGCGPHFWDPLIDLLPNTNTHVVNLGFGGPEHTKTVPGIFVTHSMGTLWALKHRVKDIEALIVINGFTNFRHFVNTRVLIMMQNNLKHDPQAQMQEFWNTYHLPHLNTFDSNKLSESLNWLLEWDASDALKALKCPVQSLIGRQDKLLKIDKMEEHWNDTETHICMDGMHAMPIQKPEWCAEHIRRIFN